MNKKTKTVAFRVTEEEFERIEKTARASGCEPNEWCRKLVLPAAGLENTFSANEEIIIEEIAKVRYMIGLGFGFLSSNELESNVWEEVKSQVDSFPEIILEQILSNRKSRKHKL